MLYYVETESENWNFLKYGRIGKHPVYIYNIIRDMGGRRMVLYRLILGSDRIHRLRKSDSHVLFMVKT